MNRYRRTDASRYRSIETRAWELFAPLDSNSAKLLLYLWTGPHSTPCGIFRLQDGYALTDLGWKPARLRKAWEVLEEADLVWRDGELVIVVPFLQSNPPPNTNVMTRWRKNLSLLPESPLFARLHARALTWLTPDGLVWLSDKLPKPSPNGSTTVPPLREQGGSPQEAEISAQGTGDREKGAGEVPEGEGGDPDPPPHDDSPASNPVRARSDLVTLFLHEGPATARSLARRAGRAEAEIQAAELAAELEKTQETRTP